MTTGHNLHGDTMPSFAVAAHDTPRYARAVKMLLVAAALVLVGGVIWASDQITLEGERTIYTVKCDQGSWEGLRCGGRLVAGDRYRYRALKNRNEVIFWIVGSSTPSGKYTDCSIRNRGNWSCNAVAEQMPSITFEMLNERATHAPAGLAAPFHAISKWKWWIMHTGLSPFSEATY